MQFDRLYVSSFLNTTFTFFDSNCLIGDNFNLKEKYPFCFFYVSEDYSSFLIVTESEEYLLDTREISFLNLCNTEIEELKKESDFEKPDIYDFFYTGYKSKEVICIDKKDIHLI